MPQRTNEFQNLVEIIHRLFAPQNATVTPSAMIEVVSGTPAREVDVLIEYETDLYPIKIAVEAKDHARAIDVTTVEQYVGKYNSVGGIIVDKVIIVARAFTPTAVKRAQQLGFELHTLTTLQESKVALFSKRPEDQRGWWVSRQLGKKVILSLIDIKGRALTSADYLHGSIISRVSKAQLGSPLAWAQRVMDNSLKDQVNDIYKEHEGEALHVWAELDFQDHILQVKSHPTIRLKKIVFDFGENVKIPDMQANVLELRMSPDKLKRIIHEKGQGTNATLNILYEDADTPPKIHLRGVPEKVKHVTIKLES